MFGKYGCLGLKCKHQQSPQKHQEKHPEIAVVREFAAVPCIVWAVGRYILQLRFALLVQHNTRAKQQEEEHQVVTQLTDRAEAAETESKLLAEKPLGFVHRAACYLCQCAQLTTCVSAVISEVKGCWKKTPGALVGIESQKPPLPLHLVCLLCHQGAGCWNQSFESSQRDTRANDVVIPSLEGGHLAEPTYTAW